LQQSEEGKWRVEFDEPWARDGARADPGAAPDEQESPAASAAEAAA